MKFLVLTEDYTNLDGKVALHYVHSRNLYYLEEGLEFYVLSFKTKNNYVIEGVNVINEKYAQNLIDNNDIDLIISHAPNFKNHIRFLNKNNHNISNIIFFFHGHEVLFRSKVYPQPYKFLLKNNSFFKKIINNGYDYIKLKLWKKVIEKYIDKVELVFVSNWMLEEFLLHTNIEKEQIYPKIHIIYNNVGKIFELENYNNDNIKEYDFVTIRNNLDESKYAIDVVISLAKENPTKTFFLAGDGIIFDYIDKPNNIVWEKRNLNHKEIIQVLNKSNYALLPTRTDAQGVMACEMATFGIPLITSNIKVCYEIFEGFNNVVLINNDSPDLSEVGFSRVYNEKNMKFFQKNTVNLEVKMIKSILGV